MEIKGKAHCLFEQSGTFKNEFIKLGIPAEDYDIRNDFGETNHVIDLFTEIEKAYGGKASIFDDITPDDLIMAFFPCTYFCQQNTTYFDGTQIHWQNLTSREKTDRILERSRKRELSYITILKFFTICDIRQIRLIVENPWASHHYLTNNFPYKPSLIDKNRQLRGDSYIKPTQYWFVNCDATYGRSFQNPRIKRKTNNVNTDERSMITPDYARNFICDFIIGKVQARISEPMLFDMN